ncbi:inhibitor of apoptosis repeat-containing protein [Pleomassaria siparia CBS 279.74]|uniref:Inhibitor of apoptosis repeat-containing protein n=1 Tax=Pleomassaria siparia CBS 279.74 TaxID=1314801 RepID=A0A6G1K162_9PLEO|nr:inhibitor of apoptosis repeat-containing protein [Pleomassaria siparia CBS 279.74]
MKNNPIIYQVRLDSFKPKSKTRRSSSRNSSSRPKKTAPKSNAWPLAAPAPHDLAFAGFQWAPSSASPDNVKCVYCDCQLDGWEEDDIPAREHLTHSPNCGYAINICIRLRNGDPGRTEEDPVSEKMMNARQNTFGDNWPLDSAAGFPSVEQMVAAGWCYDPVSDTPDAVTCPYCALSLDSWEVGDDPAEEHVKRQSDCLFFVLKELYHPEAIPYVEPPTKKTRKRASSTSSKTSRKGKTIRVMKAPARISTPPRMSTPPSQALPSPIHFSTPPAPPAPTPPPPVQAVPTPTPKISRKRVSDVQEKSKPTRTKKAHTRVSTPPLQRSPTPEPAVRETPTTPEIPERHVQQKAEFVSTPPIPQSSPKRKSDDMWEVQSQPSAKKAKLFEDEHTLSNAELEMTVEQWIKHNAEHAAEHLKEELDRQIVDFDNQGKSALGSIDSIPVH